MTKRIVQSALSLSILSVLTSVTFAADQNTTIVANPVKLETIVVTAAGYEQDVSKAPASMTVITKEELEARQYNDITDVLRNTPGVVVSGAGSAQTISIRGMGAGYTLFLVNGKRQYSKDVNPNGDDSS